jgi:hypothetical protein
LRASSWESENDEDSDTHFPFLVAGAGGGTLLPALIARAVTAASAGLWPMVVPVFAIVASAAPAFWALASWRIADGDAAA